MRTDLFQYDLPQELIAQTPAPRGESRLLVLHRSSGAVEHHRFSDLPNWLNAQDTLVLNDTRVSARRLAAIRETGLPAEALLLKRSGERAWEALVRPGLRKGRTILLYKAEPGSRFVTARVTGITAEGGRLLELPTREEREEIAGWGSAPLPPYIHTALPPDAEERYQTVYNAHEGSAAAPTAGLHFTDDMLERVRAMGVRTADVTLDVGVGTFRPVRAETIEAHEMHFEHASLGSEAAEIINATAGRVIAIGTTSVRTLESAACHTGAERVMPFSGETNLFVTPGYRFRAVDAMLTNFHMPRSTLLMLVCAFAGVEPVLAAYRAAVDARYRFFSFGDAMLIL